MITLYDVPSTKGKAWSPNTWKTRYSLNYKGLPYKTEWVEYPHIAAIYIEHKIPPTEIKHGGTLPYYSLPLIKDESSGEPVFIAESLEIAKYLDKTYPETPKVIPAGEQGLEKQKGFVGEMFALLGPEMLALLCKDTQDLLLNEASRQHSALARGKDLSAWFPGISSLDDLEFSEERRNNILGGFKERLQRLDERFGGESGLAWYAGEDISFADFALASTLTWIKVIYGEESKIWGDVKSWNGGKWGKLLEALAEYQDES